MYILDYMESLSFDRYSLILLTGIVLTWQPFSSTVDVI